MYLAFWNYGTIHLYTIANNSVWKKKIKSKELK